MLSIQRYFDHTNMLTAIISDNNINKKAIVIYKPCTEVDRYKYNNSRILYKRYNFRSNSTRHNYIQNTIPSTLIIDCDF